MSVIECQIFKPKDFIRLWVFICFKLFTMEVRYLLFLCGLCSFLSACSDKKEKVFVANERIISFSSFDIKQADYFPEEFIREVRYIPIKRDFDKDYFTFIDKVKYKNGKVYILDKSKKILSIFDESGQFLQNIGRQGTGPQDFMAISDFDLTNDGQVYLLDGFRDKDRLFVYDADHDLVGAMNLSFEADVVKVNEDGSLLFGLSSWNFGDFKGKKILRTDNELTDKFAMLDFDEGLNESIWMDYQFGSHGSEIYYNKPIDNRVHVFDQKGYLKQVLRFDFGLLNVPDQLKHNLEENFEEIKNFRYMRNFLVGFDKGYLGSLYDQGTSRVFLMDTLENQIYLGAQTDYYGFLGQFVGFDDGYALSYLDPEYIGEETMEDLPEWVKDHLRGDEFVIRLVKF